MDALRIENLTHTYSQGTPFERSALDHISMVIPSGKMVGIIGHTGSGKSTLIQHFNGLLKPSSGTVYFEGKDIFAKDTSLRDTRFQIGLVFQYPEYQLFAETVYQDIAFGPQNMGLDKEEIDQRVLESIAFVGLDTNLLNKSPFDLSGGQKRRAAIAGVLAMRPKILILDEPSAGLDPSGRDLIISQMKDYQEKTQHTVILVSHSMEEIAANVDYVFVLKDGKNFLEGTPKEVFTHADELLSAGLDIPQATKIAIALHDKGLPVDVTCYSLKELKAQLISLKGGNKHA